MAYRRHWLVPKAGASALVLVAVSQGCGDSESNPQPLPSADASIDESGTTVCKPQTCQELSAECGFAPDGCGGKVECGTCATGEFCGGGGPNKCGTNPCTPKTCTQLSASCGYASDGCSDAIDCGKCPAPLTCGGNGTANQCGCRPKSCVELSANCGTAPDECGGAIDCGNCQTGQTCGGGGKNKCGTGSCSAQTCTQLGASCGFVSDQCSKAIDCGACPGGEVCGGQGQVNQCSCMAKTCGQLSASCGKVQNGCGAEMDCGGCPTGQSCGVVISNQCSGVGGAGGAGGSGGAAGGSGGVGGLAGTSGTAGSGGGCSVTPPTSCPSASGGPTLVPVCGGYCIDATEVTRDQYAAWLGTMPLTSEQAPKCAWNTDFAPDPSCMQGPTLCKGPGCGSFPQACIDWCDAYAFCKAVGKRLCGKIGGGASSFTDFANPAEGQWFNACSSGGKYNYPYGGDPGIAETDGYDGKKCNGKDKGVGKEMPVATCSECTSTETGYAGVYDLSGNVWEWEDACNADTGLSDRCLIRGAAYYYVAVTHLRCARSASEERNNVHFAVGFRCCSDP